MKARWFSALEKLKLFSGNYGKIFAVGIGASVCLVSIRLIVSLVSPDTLRVSFLDVGQGDAILVQTPSGHDMLIDGGPTDVILSRMADKMNYFDRTLDVVVSTHEDADHATGLIPVIKKMGVRTIVTSPVHSDTAMAADLLRRMEGETRDLYVGTQGDVIDFGDGVVARIVYPEQKVPAKLDTNDASVSIVITYGEHSFLLTGDLSSKYEPKLLGSDVPKSVTVYKAGHHGSKTSSGETLLTYVKPEYAVISAGKDNRYGHPNPETISRLEKYSKEILSTIERGTITFASDGRTLEVDTEK